MPEKVKETKAYKDRAERFSINFFENHFNNSSTKDILSGVQDLPRVVLESELFKRLFENVSRQEKSEIIAIKSVKETLKLLAKNPSQEARIQRKVIGASLSSPEFGLPQLGLTWREEQEAMEMKKKLVSGESSVLMMPAKKPRLVFPPEVLQLAVQHWESTTTVDPSKHKRLVKVDKDDQEVLPTRWQTTTNEEA